MELLRVYRSAHGINPGRYEAKQTKIWDQLEGLGMMHRTVIPKLPHFIEQESMIPLSTVKERMGKEEAMKLQATSPKVIETEEALGHNQALFFSLGAPVTKPDQMMFDPIVFLKDPGSLNKNNCLVGNHFVFSWMIQMASLPKETASQIEGNYPTIENYADYVYALKDARGLLTHYIATFFDSVNDYYKFLVALGHEVVDPAMTGFKFEYLSMVSKQPGKNIYPFIPSVMVFEKEGLPLSDLEIWFMEFPRKQEIEPALRDHVNPVPLEEIRKIESEFGPTNLPWHPNFTNRIRTYDPLFWWAVKRANPNAEIKPWAVSDDPEIKWGVYQQHMSIQVPKSYFK